MHFAKLILVATWPYLHADSIIKFVKIMDRSEWSSTIFDESFHLEILKESLLRTIHDIDVTFTKEVFSSAYLFNHIFF